MLAKQTQTKNQWYLLLVHSDIFFSQKNMAKLTLLVHINKVINIFDIFNILYIYITSIYLIISQLANVS